MKHILLVLSNALEGGDDAFNTWYTGTHLPDVLKVHGFSAAQRFRISDTQMNDNATPYKYLAIYEVDEEKLSAVKDALASTAGTDAMYIDPALDTNATVAYFYTPITGMVQAQANKSAAQSVTARRADRLRRQDRRCHGRGQRHRAQARSMPPARPCTLPSLRRRRRGVGRGRSAGGGQ